uniref:Uncharacterized protein n=1 Tax=Sphaerodactylus townsendi TaxID=933632 RepID=A0ACB8GDF8_9SAUR
MEGGYQQGAGQTMAHQGSPQKTTSQPRKGILPVSESESETREEEELFTDKEEEEVDESQVPTEEAHFFTAGVNQHLLSKCMAVLHIRSPGAGFLDLVPLVDAQVTILQSFGLVSKDEGEHIKDSLDLQADHATRKTHKHLLKIQAIEPVPCSERGKGVYSILFSAPKKKW